MTKLQKVLIVDASRLVRASLSKLLRGHFDVCEEGDAESAWQTLVLDTSIIAVFSGLNIATPDGAGLVERLRASKLARLKQLPYFLLVSDSFAEATRKQACRLGVSDFIPKKTAGPEFQDLLLRLIKPENVSPPDASTVGADYGGRSEVGLDDFVLHLDGLPDLGAQLLASETRPAEAQVDDHGVPDASSSDKLDQPHGVLVFGLDGYEDFRRRYGWDLADGIVQQVTSLLEGKLRADESMLPLVGGRIAIISSMAGREPCEEFARSICKAMAEANISMRGEQVTATVSAGVAALPEDRAATTTDELLHLAISRHDAALLLGGNRVVAVTGCGGNSVNQEEFFERLKLMLADTPPETRMSCQGWLSAVCKVCRKLNEAEEGPYCPMGD